MKKRLKNLKKIANILNMKELTPLARAIDRREDDESDNKSHPAFAFEYSFGDPDIDNAIMDLYPQARHSDEFRIRLFEIIYYKLLNKAKYKLGIDRVKTGRISWKKLTIKKINHEDRIRAGLVKYLAKQIQGGKVVMIPPHELPDNIATAIAEAVVNDAFVEIFSFSTRQIVNDTLVN